MSGIMNKKGQPNLPRLAGIAIAILLTLLLIGYAFGDDVGNGNGNGNGGEECDDYDFICQARETASNGVVFLGNAIGLG